MKRMSALSRRLLLAGLASAPLARPGLVRAQSASAPVRIGLLSDVSGPYQDNGGPGSRVAAQFAADDFGGTLLGRPIEVLQADDQNKPDVASSIARQWIDSEGVSLLLDGAASSSALAILQVTREKKRVYCTTSAIANAIVGAQCSPTGFQFFGNAYSLTKGVGETLTAQGHNTWFFITVDYEAGYSLQSSTEEFIRAAGGKVLGSVRVPIGTTDFSSYMLAAQASGAKVIGLANAGADLRNCIKQASEFGLTKSGQILAGLVLEITDVLALGQNVCEGLVLTNCFYWNMSPETRSWSERYIAKMNRPPASGQASAYSATMHWLKAARAAGTLDADAVAAKMREIPVNDMFNADVRIMANGTVPHAMHIWQVKPLSQSTSKWDVFSPVGTMPSPKAFPAPDAFGCRLGKA
jgi:branched-chain amino acid transport system substrate-binding protein